jgi:hypothetical protein
MQAKYQQTGRETSQWEKPEFFHFSQESEKFEANSLALQEEKHIAEISIASFEERCCYNE